MDALGEDGGPSRLGDEEHRPLAEDDLNVVERKRKTRIDGSRSTQDL